MHELRAVLADRRLPDTTLGEIRLGLGLVMLNVGADVAGFRELEHAVDELATLPGRAARAMIALALNDQDGAAAHGWKWLGRAEQAVQNSTDEASRMAVHFTRLLLMTQDGDPAVWPLVDRLPRRDDDGAALSQISYSLCKLTEVAIQLGHDRRARDLLLEVKDLDDRSDRGRYEYFIRAEELRIDWLAGRWTGVDDRYAALGRAYPGVKQIDVDRALCQGRLALAAGRHSQALEHFTAAESLGGATCSAAVSLGIATALTAIRLAQDDPHGAWATAEPALSTLRGLRSWAYTMGLFAVAVEAALASGHRVLAEQLVTEAESGVRERDAPATLAELELARGLLSRATEPAQAAEHFAEAQRRWQEIGRPYEVAKAAECQGDALAHAGLDTAATHLTDALRGYTELGAIGDAARCQHRLRELGVETVRRPGRRGYGNELSPRELEVAELLAGGATKQDIAQTLFLSPRTVEKHVTRVLTKLGIERKTIQGGLSTSDGHGSDERV